MTGLTRRMLLGGAFASAIPLGFSLPALARGAGQSGWDWRTRPLDVPNREYQSQNAALRTAPERDRTVVMMGDSITYAWGHVQAPFFRQHGLVDRGIGGEISAQMLIRFASDVLDLEPQIVHIMAGTNDLSGVRGPYNAVETQKNIAAMAALAKDKGIAVILASVPPSIGFATQGRESPVAALNRWIEDLCARNGYTYCDYWPVLRGAGDRLKPQYGKDSVHPNAAGYAAMAPVLLAAIDTAQKDKSG